MEIHLYFDSGHILYFIENESHTVGIVFCLDQEPTKLTFFSSS